MTPVSSQKRIDEILVQQQKVSESEIAAALSRQKTVGGKLCSHLLEFGSASERDLVLALSEHFGRPGVELSSIEVPPDILELISPSFALSRLVLPFGLNAERNCVKVACVDPDNGELLSELSHLLRPRSIELHVAVELALNRALGRLYGRREHCEAAPGVSERQGAAGQAAARVPGTGAVTEAPRAIDTKHILIVSEEPATSRLLQVILERDGFMAAVVSNTEEALGLFREAHHSAILIDADLISQRPNFAQQVHAISSNTRISSFRSISDLLTKEARPSCDTSRLQQKLELFASLLTINERAPKSQSMQVAYFVHKMCRRLNLDDSQRVLVLSAAHLHERAKFYYMTVAPRDFRRLLDLVIKLLQSVYYEPAVIEILRSMYIDLSTNAWPELPFEVIGGNILTIADMFAEAFQPSMKLPLDKIEEFERSLQPKVGKLLFPEVLSTFGAIAREESLRAPISDRHGQIMIYSEALERVQALADRLRIDGFRTIIAPSWASLSRLCRRCQPDLLVMDCDDSPRSTFAQVKNLKELHIEVEHTPTVLLVAQYTLGELTPLLEWGIEDVLDRESDPDHIALKICKIWSRKEACSNTSGNDDRQLASRGHLRDINLIELLQILGIGGRTAKIGVIPEARPGELLEIHLETGQLVFARLNDLKGAEAIYAGMSWEDGIWTVQPMTEGDLSERNNQLPNEAILLEGCRLLDEMHPYH